MSKNKYYRLQELDHSNFEIVKGEPDIRGWDVRYKNGEKIGSVEELILDTKAKKVRYMVVDLDENELRLEHRKIFIPIGFAELDDQHDDVLIPNVSIDQLCRLPDYKRNSLTPELERSIASIFGRKVTVEPIASIKREERKVIEENDDMDPDFYTHEHYNADNLYKNRANRQKKPTLQDSDYDQGLRLWEKRNDGEIIDTSDLTEEERMKLLKYRRELYRERRYKNESV
ncbi:MAG TPA: PRC-barrel domain-containing protein [Chitinophagaceae bacterium]